MIFSLACPGSLKRHMIDLGWKTGRCLSSSKVYIYRCDQTSIIGSMQHRG